MVRKTLIMFSVMVAAACLYADIAPRPKYVYRLHRIGYEVLQEKVSSPEMDASSCLQEKVSSPEMDASSPESSALQIWRKVRNLFVTAPRFVPSDNEIREKGPGWKFEDEVSENEKAQLMAHVAEVKEALQNAVDDSGITVMKARYWQERSAERADRIRAITEILSHNTDLRKRCKGIPIEYLEGQLVFGLYAKERWNFESWAAQKSKNLSPSENKVLFRWQIFVVNKERRNWKGAFSECARLNKRNQDSEFSDFVDDSEDGASFVRNWFEKARSLGYVPDEVDQALLKRARKDRPKLSDKTILSGTTLSIRGVLSDDEVTALKEATQNTLGHYLEGANGPRAEKDKTQTQTFVEMSVDFTDCNDSTLAAICKILGERIGCVKICMTGKSNDVDLSPLAVLKHLRDLELRGCRVVKSRSLSETSLYHLVAENCSLGNMSFLEHVANLSTIRIEDSVFSTTENLRWATKYCGKIDIRNAKSIVDLSFVRDMNGYEHGHTYDNGRRIPSFDGGLEELDVSGSRVTNVVALANCRRLRKVTYTSEDVSEADLEFLRNLSARSVGKKETDYEVTDYPGGFSIHRGGALGRHVMDGNQRLKLEEHQRRMERHEHDMEALHREAMTRSREMQRLYEDQRRQREEEDRLCRAKRALGYLEWQRKELMRSVPFQQQDAYRRWFSERRIEETNRLATIQRECKEELDRRHRLTEEHHEKEAAHENERRAERRKLDEQRIRDMRERGVPDHIIREHELMIQRLERHERHSREMGEARRGRNRGFDSESMLSLKLSEYEQWLRSRHEEEKRHVHGEWTMW